MGSAPTKFELYPSSSRTIAAADRKLELAELHVRDGLEDLRGRESEAKVRVLVAARETILRDSLGFLLRSRSGYTVLDVCADPKSVLREVEAARPDVLVVDYESTCREGTDLLGVLKSTSSDLGVVLLCPEVDKDEIVSALRCGVRGIVLRSEPAHQLVQCIDAVARGEHWLGKSSVRGLVQALCQTDEEQLVRINKFGLTKREKQIVSAVLQGYSNPEIAADLSLSEHTVKHHLSSIFDKLGVYSRLELALFAVNHSEDLA